MTFNIHKGVHFLNRKSSVGELKKIVSSYELDFLLLQEVYGTSEEIQPLEKIADQLWPHTAYGQNSVYEGGHHGNGILSRYPILKEENIDISNHRFEKRSLLYVEVNIPDTGPLHLVCVHLDLTSWGRNRQLKKIKNWIRKNVPREEPVVLAGDFNDWQKKISEDLDSEIGWGEAFQIVHGKFAKSFPSWFPQLCLDRVYFRGLDATQAKISQPWSLGRLSDHCALWAELKKSD